jgi:peptide/nickel transport system permease protein
MKPKDTRPKYESFFTVFLQRFKKNRTGQISFYFVIFMIVLAVAAPFIANDAPVMLVSGGKVNFPGLFNPSEYLSTDWRNPSFTVDFAIWPIVRYSPVKSDLTKRVAPPSWDHPFGTDDQGMDVFARIVWGTRISISIGVISAGLTFLIGSLIGAAAGYFGGAVDVFFSRIIEIMMCFPTFFLILSVLAFMPPSYYNIIIVIGLTGWTSIARLVRGEVLKVKTLDYIRAAKVNGVKPFKIIARHILPNSITPALISATFNVAGAILVESTLSFLGFGVQPPTPSWGAIIRVAYSYIQFDQGWWLSLYPALAIFLTVTAYNLLGQAIRDSADPRLIE